MHPQDIDYPYGTAASAVSNAAVRIVREYTGRGPTSAHTDISPDLVTIMFQDTLTKGERALAAKSNAELVRQFRRHSQNTMRVDLIAAVEMNVERKVIAFLSDHHIEPDVAVETFVLEPHDGDEEQEA